MAALSISKKRLIVYLDINRLKKLLDHNINGKFYDCLVNMYSNDVSCIKIGDSITSHPHL